MTMEGTSFCEGYMGTAFDSFPCGLCICPVSYTHLDVYKRQASDHPAPRGRYYPAAGNSRHDQPDAV